MNQLVHILVLFGYYQVNLKIDTIFPRVISKFTLNHKLSALDRSYTLLLFELLFIDILATNDVFSCKICSCVLFVDNFYEVESLNCDQSLGDKELQKTFD